MGFFAAGIWVLAIHQHGGLKSKTAGFTLPTQRKNAVFLRVGILSNTKAKIPLRGFFDFGMNSALIKGATQIEKQETYMYCIAQFEKIKGAGNMANIAKHNLRTHLSEADKERVDPTLSHLNKILFNPIGIDPKSAPSVWEKLGEHWAKKGIEPKADSVHAIDLILSTSPEFWGQWRIKGVVTKEGQKKIDHWCQVQLDFIQNHFGPEALKFAVLHLDETSPHIHLLLSPEQTKVLKYKKPVWLSRKNGHQLKCKTVESCFLEKILDELCQGK